MNLTIPKQFAMINQKPLIVHTLEKISSIEEIDDVYVVCHKDWVEHMSNLISSYELDKVKKIVLGGNSGCQSIKNAVTCISNNCDKTDMVVIHDGNRPLITEEIVKDAIFICKKYGNAVASIPCVEVVYDTIDGIKSNRLIDRNTIRRTQTPHVFYLEDLVNVYSKLEKITPEPAATCDLFTNLGVPIYFSRGSILNFKITYPEDIELFQSILSQSNEKKR